MACIDNGEMIIPVGRRRVLLRPSIGALCAIDRQTGFAIGKLIETMPESSLRIIANEGMRAAGSPVFRMTDKALREVRGHLRAFLLRGIGCVDETLSVRQPDWRDMFVTYVGLMGRPVSEFRDITLAEYSLAVEGFCLLHHIDSAAASAPATSQDLAEMVKRFPDRVVGRG